jgi:dTDP-glucose 4,6-dehydratase
MRIVSNRSHQAGASLRGRRVWIAGGRGFIGSRLSLLLGPEGLGDSPGYGAALHHLEGDIGDPDTVRSSIAAAGPDFLINLAAPVDVRRDPALVPRMEHVILGGLRNVLAAMANLRGQPRLLHCGTCEEYGAIDAPFSEAATPGEPVSPYAAAKLRATREALASGARVTVARPFLTYGPGQRGDGLLPAAIRAALTGQSFAMTRGTHSREFNFVDDTATDLAELLICEEAIGQIVNLGCGEERLVIEVAKLAWELAGGAPEELQVGARPCRPADIPRLFADVSLARRLLGGRERVALATGLKATVAGFRSTMTKEEAHGN